MRYYIIVINMDYYAHTAINVRSEEVHTQYEWG